MTGVILLGALCVLLPYVIARLHFVFGELTRALVYLIALVQVLIVPVLVALDPNASFSSDTYSLGAGLGTVLISAAEFAIFVGTAVGLWLATTFIGRREKGMAVHRAEEMLKDLDRLKPQSRDIRRP